MEQEDNVVALLLKVELITMKFECDITIGDELLKLVK